MGLITETDQTIYLSASLVKANCLMTSCLASANTARTCLIEKPSCIK